MRRAILLLMAALGAAVAVAAPVPATRPNGKANWNAGKNGLGRIEGDRLLIVDDSPEQGGYLGSFALPVEPGRDYEARFRYRSSAAAYRAALGGVSLEFADAAGQALPDKFSFQLPADSQGEQRGALVAKAPAAAKSVRIVIRSYAAAVGRIELSGVEFGPAAAPAATATATASGFQALPVRRPDGRMNWNFGKNGIGRAEDELLVLRDDSPEQGGYIGSFAQAAEEGKYYLLRFELSSFSDTNRASVGGANLEFYDRAGKQLDRAVLAIPYSTHGRKVVELPAAAPAGSATLRISFRTYAAPCSRIEIGRVELGEITAAEYGEKKDLRPDFGQDFEPPSAEAVRALAALLPEQGFRPLPPPGDRAFWDRAAAAFERKDELIALAEAGLATPVEVIDRDFYLRHLEAVDREAPFRYRKLYHARSDLLNRLALAECLENRGRFLDKIRELTASILEEPSWVAPYHDRPGDNIHGRRITVDLGASGRGALLATVSRTFAASLPAELRERIDRRIEERLLAPYRRRIVAGRIAVGFNWMLALNNWGAVCSSNLAYTAMILDLPKEEKALLLLGTKFCMGQYLSSIPPDGYCSEGIGYWNYGFGHYMMYAGALHAWTGGAVDEFKLPAAERMARFVDRFELHDRCFPAFADTSMNNGVKPFNELAAARFYGCASRRNSFWINDYLPHNTLAFRLLLDPATPPAGRGSLPARDYFEQSQVLICRDDAAPRLSLAAKGGHNAEQHNHNDLGSYVIRYGNLIAVCDPGGEEYNSRTFTADRYQSDLINSFGHPVPRPAGVLQSPGRPFAARVLEHSFAAEGDSLKLDLRGGYALPELELLERAFTFRRGAARGVTVADRFRFASPQSFETAVVTTAEFEVIDARTIEFFNSDYRVRLHVDSEPGPVRITHAPLTAKPMTPGMKPPVRLAIALAEPAATGSIRLVYTPAVP